MQLLCLDIILVYWWLFLLDRCVGIDLHEAHLARLALIRYKVLEIELVVWLQYWLTDEFDPRFLLFHVANLGEVGVELRHDLPTLLVHTLFKIFVGDRLFGEVLLFVGVHHIQSTLKVLLFAQSAFLISSWLLNLILIASRKELKYQPLLGSWSKVGQIRQRLLSLLFLLIVAFLYYDLRTDFALFFLFRLPRYMRHTWLISRDPDLRWEMRLLIDDYERLLPWILPIQLVQIDYVWLLGIGKFFIVRVLPPLLEHNYTNL